MSLREISLRSGQWLTEIHNSQRAENSAFGELNINGISVHVISPQGMGTMVEEWAGGLGARGQGGLG